MLHIPKGGEKISDVLFNESKVWRYCWNATKKRFHPEMWWEVCQNLDLGLTGSYCSADDIKIIFNNLTQNRPKGWEKFF